MGIKTSLTTDDMNKLKILQQKEVELLDEFVRICEQYYLRYYIAYGTLLGAIRHKGFIPWDDDIDVVMPREDFEKFVKIASSATKKGYFLQYFCTDNNYLDISAKLRNNDTIYATSEHKRYNYKNYGCWIDIFPLDNFNGPYTFDYYVKYIFTIKFINRIVMHRAICRLDGLGIKAKIVTYFSRLLPKRIWFYIRDKLCQINRNNNSEFVSCLSIPYKINKAVYKRTVFSDSVKVLFEGRLYNAPAGWNDFLTQVYGDYMKLPPVEERFFKHEAENWII